MLRALFDQVTLEEKLAKAERLADALTGTRDAWLGLALRGDILRELGRFHEAIDDYSCTLEFFGGESKLRSVLAQGAYSIDSHHTRFLRGTCHHALCDREGALTDFRAAYAERKNPEYQEWIDLAEQLPNGDLP